MSSQPLTGQRMDFDTKLVAISELKPHPRNYRQHPDDQLEHIVTSIKEHGFYRNVVIAQDGTILAGHGVVKASQKIGQEFVPAVRLPIDAESPQALKVLAGDNEIAHLSVNDDRALTELLKQIKEDEANLTGLLGTGYDEMMLATLAMVTRPASEIANIDEAVQWVGMPQYDEGEERIKAVVTFRTPEDRLKFMEQLGIEKPLSTNHQTWSFWWPGKGRDDLSSVRFQG
jgi:hypothetical protein